MKTNTTLWEFIIENGTYKLVALFITLILWLTILGRRDFVYSKNIDVEFQTAPHLSVIEQSYNYIRVRVTGPRASLKRFVESPSNQAILIDISSAGEGKIEIPLSERKLELPMGVRVVSIKPQKIEVTVVQKKTYEEDLSKKNHMDTESGIENDKKGN